MGDPVMDPEKRALWLLYHAEEILHRTRLEPTYFVSTYAHYKDEKTKKECIGYSLFVEHLCPGRLAGKDTPAVPCRGRKCEFDQHEIAFSTTGETANSLRVKFRRWAEARAVKKGGKA